MQNLTMDLCASSVTHKERNLYITTAIITALAHGSAALLRQLAAAALRQRCVVSQSVDVRVAGLDHA